MHRSLKFVAALSLGALVMAAPVRAEEGGAKKEGGAKREGVEGKRPRREGRSPGARLGQLVDQLGLTEEQKTQVQPILQSTQEEIAKIQQDQTLTPEQKRPKMREAHQAAMTKIAEILTPEQKEKLKTLQAERGDGARKGPKDGERPRKRPKGGEKAPKEGGDKN